MTTLDSPRDRTDTGGYPAYAGDLFGELHLAIADAPTAAPAALRAPLLPGLTICGTASVAAAWLSRHHGFPVILLGLLVGLSLSFAGREPAAARGLDFASRTFLRLGIVVLGFQVTFAQIGALGAGPFLALMVVMAAAFAAGLAGARLAGQSRYAGILAGGATAICGASAALALYGVIGRRRLDQAQFALRLAALREALDR